MTHFNITHILPRHMRNLRAYTEVIDTVRWGLHQLGHQTTYSINAFCSDTRNIVFGGHLAPRMLFACPEDTIYYNLEQIRGNPQFSAKDPHPSAALMAAKLQVWEYSGANLETWKALNPKHPVKLVPIGYAPILTHITEAEEQDIDVLIYGSVGERRLSVFSSIGQMVNSGVSSVYACGLFGAARDSLIARSKIILNINHVTDGKIFEIVRASYLMANSKAVVADFSLDTFIESGIPSGILFAPVEAIPEACHLLLSDESARRQLGRNAFECITQRDIRVFLSDALR